MKAIEILAVTLIIAAAGLPVFAQKNSGDAPPVNSFFERGPAKEYALKSVYVGGEVQDPGPVEFAALPLRGVAVKELAFEKGGDSFKGAYFYTGYSLYDILNVKPVKKVSTDFSPEVDLYVVVANENGDKAVFSWGEIYYTRDNFNTLIPKTVRAINPAKGDIEWPLPAVPRLVCGGDLYNLRYISNPTRITVKSVAGVFPGKKYGDGKEPEFVIVNGATTTVVSDPSKFTLGRSHPYAAYGHGMGFKGVVAKEGFLLKEMLLKAGVNPREAGGALAVVSAEDSYRASFSLSEIINRNDSEDFLIVDKGLEEEGYNRYALFAPSDFFEDRNVRSVNKIEIMKI